MTEEQDRPIAGLRALLGDLVEEPERADSECATVRGKLDLYVSDELDGLDVRARHPTLWNHLQTCAACRLEHDSLLDLLAAEARGELTPLPARPPAVLAPVEPPWRAVIVPSDKPRPELLFVFAPAYLRQSLRPITTAAGLRVAEQRPSWDTLLVSYLGDTPAGEVMVQVYARPDASDPAMCLLTVVAVAEPMPHAVSLEWGGQTLEATLGPDGDGQLGPVPLAALDESGLTEDSFALHLLT
jgi:hypothetical protein